MKKLFGTIAAVSLLGAGATTSLLALTGYASAADLGSPVYRAPVAVPVAFSWTGFYIGGHVGAGSGTTEWNAISMFTAPGPTFPTPDTTGATPVNGFLGGIQGGFNYQINWAVLGVEAQWSGSRLTGSGSCFADVAPTAPFAGPRIIGAPITLNGDIDTNCSSTVRSLGTIAGRFGVSTDRTMLYLKGGWGWANDRFSIHSTGASFSTPPYTTYGYADITDTRWGPMVGAGHDLAVLLRRAEIEQRG
jgi:outer membrane immunogenic protein